MSDGVRLIADAAELEQARDALDRLAPARGPHADVYDTASWLLAWLAAAEPPAGSLRLLVAERGDAPVAMLPLVRGSRGVWTMAGTGLRPRFRPVIDEIEPGPQARDALAQLVEQAVRDGMRVLDLPALPSDDPATEALVAALRTAGFSVQTRPASAETRSS